MDSGFVKASVTITWANDKNRFACSTYEKNLKLKPFCGDVRKVKSFPSADIVIACNPCQGFSFIGNRDPSDERNYLYREVIRCLKQVQPKFFITENVRGLKYLYKGKFLKLMLRRFNEVGYSAKYELINVKNYGIPQDRERIIIVGVRKDIDFDYIFPKKTHGPGLKPYSTLRETIGDLPPPKAGEFFDSEDYPFFYMSRNRVRSWDGVSYTIQASGRHTPLHPSSPPMKHVGKDKWEFTEDIKKYRRLSIRECARIQTFPDDYIFEGSLNSQYLLIGNAVPPLLACQIAKSLPL